MKQGDHNKTQWKPAEHPPPSCMLTQLQTYGITDKCGRRLRFLQENFWLRNAETSYFINKTKFIKNKQIQCDNNQETCCESHAIHWISIIQPVSREHSRRLTGMQRELPFHPCRPNQVTQAFPCPKYPISSVSPGPGPGGRNQHMFFHIYFTATQWAGLLLCLQSFMNIETTGKQLCRRMQK